MTKPTISVLANSLPRGGPFLLGSALQLLGYRKYAKVEDNALEDDTSPSAFNYLEAKIALNGRKTQAGEGMVGISPFSPCHLEQSLVQDCLSRLANDEYIPAHIPWTPALPAALEESNCRHIMIIRDPRSLLLSLLFDTHPMPRFLIEPFASMSPETQLEFMLSGGKVPQSEMVLQPFVDVFNSMQAWQDSASCLIVRFEDLAGPQSGGSSQQQNDTLAKISAFLDLPIRAFSDQQLETIKDPSIPTFRLDQMDSWNKVVSNRIIERVLGMYNTLKLSPEPSEAKNLKTAPLSVAQET